MSEKVFLMMISLPLITVLLIFAMRYFAAVQQAKVRVAADQADRLNTEKTLAAMAATLDDVKLRVTSIEKMLREVD